MAKSFYLSNVTLLVCPNLKLLVYGFKETKKKISLLLNSGKKYTTWI